MVYGVWCMGYGVCHVYGKSACVVDASRTSKLIISTDRRVKAVLECLDFQKYAMADPLCPDDWVFKFQILLKT